tara:strand:- start:11 stop:400 length:390 start_codon:yes stop_codon:yes gene_type:complete
MNIEFETKNPYFIFSVNDFLDSKDYENLRQNFPDIYYFIQKDNLKYTLESYTQNYKDLCKNNLAMKNFHEKIMTKEFLFLLYKKLYLYFLKSRTKDPKNFLRLLRFPKFSSEEFGQNNYKNFFFQKIKI